MSIESFIALVVPLAHISGSLCALHAAYHAHTTEGGIAWAVSLIAFPWLALPAYALFGPPASNTLTMQLQNVRSQALPPMLVAVPPEAFVPDDHTAPRFDFLADLGPTPITRSPKPELLVDGPEIFKHFFDVVESAERDLSIQFYIMRSDKIGTKFRDALIARAREGVRVRLLHDSIGARNAGSAYWRALRDAGVEVRSFDVRRRMSRILYINFRNHRKIVAADGRVAIVGGPNLADEYLGPSQWFPDWRDTAVRLTGPAAAIATTTFFEDWVWTGGTLDRPFLDPEPGEAGQTSPILLYPTGPADALPACSLGLIHLITEAQKRVWIATPYFVPDLDVLTALRVAALRGVDVRIIIPDIPDHKIVWYAAFAYAEDVLRTGAKIYRYQPGFMHQKTVLIDDWAAGIGTVNLDSRSLRLNFENMVYVFDPTFNEEVAAMLENDIARSKSYDEEAHAARPRKIRILAPAARLLGPLL
ncbi:cardiolipin synthase [Acuticoccus sp. M5D2P5]|uniref:cardiolipin synthase n=1 Tax=Acuticoccus kalidii TaxID=2910977 RepID=UPI001F3A6E1F|nr:cardiolipin synthase [Acuticoccus kalidii]MCF3935560.1 cardiolipin synthase [Acuticoccus kalidii]